MIWVIALKNNRLKNGRFGNKYNKKERMKMISLYNSGLTSSKVGEIMNCSDWTVLNAINQFGHKARSTRKYTVNEHFFDIIDTQEKAYWLGFITADGSVRRNSLKVALKKSDIKHLEKIKSHLEASNPIKIRSYNDYEYCEIVIYSLKLILALECLGIKERKTNYAAPFNEMPNKLISHYWRGIFDGDGCLTKYITESKREAWDLSVVGTQSICVGFNKFIKTLVKTKASVFKRKNIYRTSYTGINLPKEIIKVLYSDSKVYLDRKKKLSIELLQTQSKSKQNFRINPVHIP